MTIRETIEEFLQTLPEEIREAIAGVCFEVMGKPTEEMEMELGVSPSEESIYLETGDEGSPGMFEEDEDLTQTIYLFADNISPKTRAHVLYLLSHELGHALGLDEDELKEAGVGPLEDEQC